MNDITLVTVTRSNSLREALSILDRTGSGLLLLVDGNGTFERTLTDGDLRRLILSGATLDSALTVVPRIASLVVPEGASRREALDIMNQQGINHLPVIDTAGKIVAILNRKVIDEQILLSTPHMGDTERDFVEEAFRTLKGDLGLRPIHHHKAERIEAHLFVAFLAYCLSVTLRQRLKAFCSGLMPRVVFEKLATLQLIDVCVPTTDGRALLLVRHTEPDRDVALLLARLGLVLPAQPPPRIRAPAPGLYPM